jgi:hypothetical protein
VVTDERLQELADRLVAVPGVLAVVLGGSRARGMHTEESDVDLGLYYRPDLDVTALGHLAQEVAGVDATVTRPGEWGPWVDGGGWLHVDGTAVDWIYRNLDRVNTAWTDAQAGQFSFHFQIGHPLGVPDFSYVGEVALGRVLADPTGELTSLHTVTQNYPPRLRDAVILRALWEADFDLMIAAKAVSRSDTTYLAGCLFRAVELCAHALHAHAGQWLINEKGAIHAAGNLPATPTNFAERAHHILARIGRTPAELRSAITQTNDLTLETAAICHHPR